MDKAYGPKILGTLSSSYFGQQGNEGRVEALKVSEFAAPQLSMTSFLIIGQQA